MQLCFGKVGNGLAGVKAEGEEGAHKAGQNCDGDPLGEVVVTLASFKLFLQVSSPAPWSSPQPR